MRLHAENFGTHERLSFRSDAPVVSVVGRNRVGKTTVRDAIEFALLGTCELRGFTLKKDVARYMIRGTADRASVELALSNRPWAVRRTMKADGTQRIEIDRYGNGGWVAIPAADWSAFLGIEPEVVRVALESDSFWRAPAADRRRLLISLSGTSALSPERIIEALDPRARVYPDEGFRSWLLTAAALAVEKGFAVANAQVVELRRNLKRERDALPEARDPAGFDPIVEGVDAREGTLDDLRRGVAEARAELAKARELRARAAGGLSERIRALGEQRAEADRRWNAAGKALLDEFARPDGDEESLAISAVEIEEEVAAIGRACARANWEVGERERELEQYTRAAVPPRPAPEPGEKPALCPLVPVEMACAATPAAWAKATAPIVAAAKAAREDAERVAAEARANADAVREELIDARSRRDAEQAKHAAATERLARRRQIDAELRTAKDAYDVAHVQLLAAERELEQLGAGPSEEDLAFIERRIVERETIVKVRERYEAEVALWERTGKERDRLNRAIEFVDLVEHELRPDGVEARLSGDGRATLARSMVELSDAIGTQVEVTAESDVTIEGRPILSASKSEQRVAGAVLQHAIAEAVNLPLIVIDELDALDVEWRGRFAAFAAAGPTSVQILGLATTSVEEPGPPPRGYETVWLRSGRDATMIRHDPAA